MKSDMIMDPKLKNDNKGYYLYFRIFLIIKMQYQARKSEIGHPVVIQSGVLDENLVEMHENHNIFPTFRVSICVLFGWTGY